MAKNNFSNAERSQVLWDNTEVTIGALATVTAAVASSRIDTAKENGFRILKTQYWCWWRGFTAGEGPILWGVEPGAGAGSIASTIQADPQTMGNEGKIAREQAMLPVFVLEQFTAEDAAQLKTWAQGEFAMKWSIQEGSALNYFVFNPSGSTFTTGGTLKVVAKHFGVWLKD